MSKDAANAAMKPTCTFEDCGKPHMARGFCSGHYRQQRKGQELRPLRTRLTLEQRFWIKVRKTPECWLWTASISDGYGQIWVDGRLRIAHRLSWEFINGPIPDGLDLDHRCGNRKCVNPAHLRPTTRSQNMQHRIGNQRNNTSGIRGVYWDKRRDKWYVQATLDGRTYSGGLHSTLEAADQAARALRAKLHTHDDHDKWLKKQKETL